MTETEFIEAAESLLAAVEDAVEDSGLDIESEMSGNVLTLEAESGEQAVINLHVPTQQVWLASRRGGVHFSPAGGRWLSTRTGSDFGAELDRALSFIAGVPVKLSL